MTPVLDRAVFKAWLESLDPYASVGQAGMPMSCPVARYFTQGQGATAASVCAVNTAVMWTDTWVDAAAPAWATQFICHIDKLRSNSPIQAKTALAILESIDG